ncbi:glycosyltransferase family 2 protein [Candidatus Woesearchaeota archaeon]|nr:glycosyltransferase family 2 protein [Candidatus Woesearchaeota archaeon]
MKLFVMIPAFNEERNIAKVIKEIPRNINKVKSVKVLVIDDGCTDGTADVAKKAGADFIIHNKKNMGLAVSFRRGLEECLRRGADIIVNTDADFQYNQKEIPKLIAPIVDSAADVVLSDRRVLSLNHMPAGKKYGNVLASFVTRFAAGYSVRDAQSGFRAFSREAALRLNVMSDYTYVQETIIQAVDKRLTIVQVPIEFRKRSGKSRLISNIWNYAKRAGSMIIRSYVRYRPLKVFLTLGLIPFLIGMTLAVRFSIFWLDGKGAGHIQSLILAAILIMVGFQMVVLALISDSIDAQRKVNEEILYRIKKREYS